MTHYDDAALGALYSKDRTIFRVWAPGALRMQLKTYPSGHEGEATVYEMYKDPNGFWMQVLEGDRHGLYTYEVTHYHGSLRWWTLRKALGVNGNRGMVVDLARTNPEGWDISPSRP